MPVVFRPAREETKIGRVRRRGVTSGKCCPVCVRQWSPVGSNFPQSARELPVIAGQVGSAAVRCEHMLPYWSSNVFEPGRTSNPSGGPVRPDSREI
jgi:hypothetical protein